ncbi:helix-hairpin-helix domain-containing protein [Poseidonocella sp. HB161398]|uniref:helix-hairpin-helix domain-containing protein n=1 Tax=Poseidonocella sp. HB161398 TaxID=2320855 RepID=UPI00110944C8|nr:helix-hairpin-helix domain-containing protein [Poseidonocella sp. HB161398]
MTHEADTEAPAAPDGNAAVAERLRRYADLLETQGGDGFRLRAYLKAADEIDALSQPLRLIYETGGTDALVRLHGIGRGIAAAIAEMLATGHWTQLDRLQGEATPEAVFRTIPGIGPAIARSLADTLEVETLEELETALRLGARHVPGVGPRRRQAILAAIGARFARLPHARHAGPQPHEPPVSLLVDADALYRSKAEAGDLPRIAPKRFNPAREAWLPVMHARRNGWHLTMLYSNTARAHELGRTRDWVVIYFHEEDGPERRRTIVTERQGPLAGRRVVRGREAECRDLYAGLQSGIRN